MRQVSSREQPPRDDYRPPAQFLVHVAAICVWQCPPEIESNLRACKSPLYMLPLFPRPPREARCEGRKPERARVLILRCVESFYTRGDY